MVTFLLLLIAVSFLALNDAASSIGKANFMTEAAENKGAVCLDGSAGNYYFAKGEETTKYVLFLEGGGWCWNEEQCWTRRSQTLGSTTTDAKEYDLNKIGFLGNDSSKSPLFYDWNKVYFRYCDGMSFGGNLDKPIMNASNSSEFMYYRGKRLLDAMFASLAANYDLNKATDFVIGGGSAGGLAVFLHSNYIAHNFFNLSQTKLVSMPDVGFFIEYNGWNGQTQFANKMKYIYAMQNVSSSIMDSRCFDNANWNDSECVFAQNVGGDIEIPTFVLNSKYDSYQAQNILGTGTSNATLLNEYGQNFTMILMDDFLAKNDENGNIFGAFIDGCYHHGASEPTYWYELNIDGYTQATAFMQFYNGLGKENNRLFWYQNVTYPCQKCCGSTASRHK